MDQRLVVKNFGPITNVSLEVKKFTILIGEQASGKSTIAKLLSVLKDAYSVLGFMPLEARFKHYGLAGYFKTNTVIEYDSPLYKITCKGLDKAKIVIKDPDLKEAADKLSPLASFFETSGVVTVNTVYDTLANQGMQTSVYIPAERILISSITDDPFDYRSNLPDYLTAFGKLFIEARKELSGINFDWLKLKYIYSQNDNWISHKAKKVRMSESATGFQILVPLLLAFEKSSRITKSAVSYFIEEPEISLFPTTQYALVKYLVDKCHSDDTSLFITTHSPYILSSFNNLIYAAHVGEHSEKQSDKIIGKEYWINSGLVSAMKLDSKGIGVELVDSELEQIKVEEIDVISRQINSEFDQLYNLNFKRKQKAK